MPQFIPLDACKASPVLGVGLCKPHYRYDDPPVLGYTYQPGYVYEGPWNPADPVTAEAEKETCPTERDDTFHYVMRVDDKGFVNPSPWRDQYDIVIVGDSFAVPFARVYWLDVLREATGKTALGLGVAGWGPLSELEALRMYGLDKNPEWVIMLYFEGNDLFNAEQYDVRRRAGVDWLTYEAQQVGLLERLAAPYALRAWGDAVFNPPSPVETCRYPMEVSTNTHTFETIFFYPHIHMLSKSSQQIKSSSAWALTRQAILDARTEAETVGARFLLVYVPAKEHIYWSRLWDDEDVNNFLALTDPLRSYEEFSETVDAQMAVVETFVEAHEINLLNLTGPIWLRFVEGAELYHFADGHWNAAGNRLVGELIADYIEAQ